MRARLTQYGDYATWITFEVMAGFTVRLVFSDDVVKSAIARIGHGPGEKADAFVYNVKDDGKTYVFLPLDADESTIAHECWHVIHRMFEYCGVDGFDNEMTAYHLDHLIEYVYKFKRAIQATSTRKHRR
jgi:hypothetical protein